jgi:hypothetical protein
VEYYTYNACERRKDIMRCHRSVYVMCSLKGTSVSDYHGSVEGFADTAAAMEGKKLNVARMLCSLFLLHDTTNIIVFDDSEELCLISCDIGTLPFAISSSEFFFLESDDI